MIGLTREGAVLSWGRNCNGRLGAEGADELGHPTAAMAATAHAAARGATPLQGRGRVVQLPPRAQAVGRATEAASGGGGASRCGTEVRCVRLPYLDGVGMASDAGDPDQAGDRLNKASDPDKAGDALPTANGSSADDNLLEEGADGTVAAAARVVSVACGGAHTLLLCGLHMPQAKSNGSPRRASANGSPRRPKRAVDPAMCFLDYGTGGSGPLTAGGGNSGAGSGAAASSPRAARFRAVAGMGFTVTVHVRDAAGMDCALPEGARFEATLIGRKGQEVPLIASDCL